jgi:hypothetical protein
VLETLSSILGISFVSGINLYAAILTIGLAQRFGWIQGLPASMQVLSHPAVLIAAGCFYLLEFFADKIPFLTPIWDGIHTFIRPIGAALLALESSANFPPIARVSIALLSGSVALGTHSSKAGFRLLAHASPDPVTHSAISVAEDLSVVGLLLLAYKNPAIALPLLVFLTLLVGVFAPVLCRIARFMIAGFAGRVRSWFGEGRRGYIPEWAGSQQAIRCYSRSGRVLQRVRLGYLRKEDGKYRFVSRRWFHSRTRVMAGTPAIRRGLIYDVLTIGGDSFYVTKDWAKRCRKRLIEVRTPAPIAQVRATGR